MVQKKYVGKYIRFFFKFPFFWFSQNASSTHKNFFILIKKISQENPMSSFVCFCGKIHVYVYIYMNVSIYKKFITIYIYIYIYIHINLCFKVHFWAPQPRFRNFFLRTLLFNKKVFLITRCILRRWKFRNLKKKYVS